MNALARIRERWSLARARWSARRRFRRWRVGSPVIATGTNAEILGYDDYLEKRFQLARRSLRDAVSEAKTHKAKYPVASPYRMTQQGFRMNPIARACIDLLVQAANMAQPVVEDMSGAEAEGPVPDQIRAFLSNPTGVFDGGVRRLGPLSWWDVFSRHLLDLYAAGNGMWEIVPGEVFSTRPQMLSRLAPESTWIIPDDDFGVEPGAYIRAYVLELDGEPYFVPPERVIHNRFWDPMDPFFGVPKMWSAIRAVAADNEQADFQMTTVQNMGVPPGVLEYDPKALFEAGLSLNPHSNPEDREAMESMRDRFMEMYGGRHRGKAAIAYGFKYKLIGMNMRDLDASALVRISESRIATAHGVPMTLLNRSSPEPDRPGAATRQMKEHFYTTTVAGLVDGIESVTGPRIVQWFDPGTPADRQRYRLRLDLSLVDVIREQRLKRAREAGQVFQSGIADRGTCQKMAGIRQHGTLDEFVPVEKSSLPDRMPGDQGEGVGP